YLNYGDNYPLIEGFIKSVFAHKTVLFVGYSFNDVNLKLILQSVRNILGNDFQNAYLLNVDDDIHESNRKYFKNKGITVMHYADADENAQENFIEAYLNGNNAFGERFLSINSTLKEKGHKLFNFLKFLEVYDVFNEAISGNHIIDQMYYSLKRFDEMNNISPDFIADLYPFKNSDYSYPIYENYGLLAINKDIEKLFFDETEIINDAIVFKRTKSNKKKEIEDKQLEKKLTTVVEKLNDSLILVIGKENKQSDSFGFKGWSNDKKWIKIKGNESTPTNSDFMDLELNEALKKLKNTEVGSNTKIIEDMILGVAYFKFSNFHLAYQVFEQASAKAWSRGQYLAYFIAKYNIRIMRYLLKQFDQNLSEEQRKKIFKIMEDIDFDKLLYELPLSGKQEYHLLKMIRDQQFLHRGHAIIMQNVSRLDEIYNVFERGGSSSGTDYLVLINHELQKLSKFYLNNPLVLDEFNDFSKVIQDGIKGYLISYAMPSEYKNKLKHFSYFFFWLFSHYGSKKKFENICQNYFIKELKFEDDELVKCVELTNNFLRSFIKESNSFGKRISPNSDLLYLTESRFFFADKTKRIFNNIFSQLSYTEIKSDCADDLINNLISFLKFENFIGGDSIPILRSFIFRNYHLFSRENIIELLGIVSKKDSKFYDYDFYRAIAHVIEKNQYEPISDGKLIDANIAMIENKGLEALSLVSLWKLSNSNLKDKIKKEIEDALNNNFNNKLFVISCVESILQPKDFLKEYVQWVNREKREHFHYHNGLFSQINYTFLIFVHFIYRYNLDESPELNELTNLSEYQKFYLDPENYKYSSFEIDWILNDYRDSFFERFSKIPELRKRIEKHLKENYDEKLSRMYIKHFL
ncbi:MAG: SIR2 family protein, partial [bacterium]